MLQYPTLPILLEKIIIINMTEYKLYSQILTMKSISLLNQVASVLIFSNAYLLCLMIIY